jgi:hypothetical protein
MGQGSGTYSSSITIAVGGSTPTYGFYVFP